MRLRSFKLRFADNHVRIVPATDARGCPFSGPGVDLRGEAAARALALGEPLVSLLAEVEPGIAVRALAVDLERPRVTATLSPLVQAGDAPGESASGEPGPGRRRSSDERARVVRLDEGAVLERLVEVSNALCEHLAAAAAEALARRQESGEAAGDEKEI